MTRVAGAHFAAATLYLVLGACGLVWIAPLLATGDFLSPHVAGVAHLFTLGWLTMAIFGALHQLLPVALGAPIKWPKASYTSLLTFVPGVGALVIGVTASSDLMRHIGLALVGVGVIVTAINIGATLATAKNHDATWAGMTIAFVFLLSTLVLGMVLLHNLHNGSLAQARVRVLEIHLHVAIIGWVLIMIVGVSNRLLPMFMLAHGGSTKWTKRALALFAAGVPILATGIWTSRAIVNWLGVLLLVAGLVCFGRQAYEFYRTRVRKQIDIGVQFAGVGFVFLALSSLLGIVVLCRSTLPNAGHASHLALLPATRLATAYVLTGLLGGVVTYVVGFYYKIVPLLSWTVHHRRQTNMRGVTTVAQLYSAPVARAQLVAMPAAVATLIVAILAGSTHWARAGATLYLVSVLVFAGQMVRVALGGHFGGHSS